MTEELTANQLCQQILDILHKYQGRKFTVAEIAAKFGVDQNNSNYQNYVQETSRIGIQLDKLWRWNKICATGLQRNDRRYWIEK